MKKLYRRAIIGLIITLLTACSSMPKEYTILKEKINAKEYNAHELQGILNKYISHAGEFDTRPYIELLLKHGIDINNQSFNENLTALMLACKESATPADTFNLLIASGADINRLIPENDKTRPGVTALHLCAGIDAIYADTTGDTATHQHGNAEGYKILIAHDANKFIKDKKGHSANSVLKTLGKYDLTQLQAASSRAHQEQQKKDDAERKERFNTTWKRDIYLPTELRKNKYMTALVKRIKDKRYDDALIYFEFLKRMEIDLPHSYTFFYGEALLNSEQPQQALTALLAYIKVTDSTAAHHESALTLIKKARTVLRHQGSVD